MAELTKDTVIAWFDRIKVFYGDYEKLNILRDLALRALEQTNAAGQVSTVSQDVLTPDGQKGRWPVPAAPPSELKVPGSVSAGASEPGERCISRSSAEPVNRVAAPARSEPCTVIWSEPRQMWDGSWYRVGTSTGVNIPEQPESPPTQVPADELDALVERLRWGEVSRLASLQAASAIVALRKEITRDNQLWGANWNAMKERAEAAERDAARYLWLRDASVTNGAIDPDDDDFWNDLGDLLGEKFDAAIDSAMKVA